MKRSAYCFLTDIPPSRDGVLLFNFYTLTMIALRGRDSIAARKILAKPNAPTTGSAGAVRRMLVEGGFILAEAVDERALLLRQRRNALAGERGLSLTILPTLDCNFGCTYCYERRRPTSMTPEVEAALSTFVRGRVKQGGRLAVTWFGGEPLLRLDILERLSRDFRRICRSRKASYSASVITNGFLLDASAVRRLGRIGVTNAQVTIDGPPDWHDVRRPTRSKGPTFDRIMRNIKAASRRLSIDIRVNVDHGNIHALPELLNILSAEGLERRIGLYPGQTYPYTSACADVAGSCLTDADFALFGLELTLDLARRTFTTRFGLPASRNLVCLAENPNGFVIRPNGGICNCWNESAARKQEIGDLDDDDPDKLLRRKQAWLTKDPFALECADCILLPICMGGCPFIFKTKGRLSCHPWKHHLRESVLMHYYLQRLKKEREIGHRAAEIIRVARKALPNFRALPEPAKNVADGTTAD